MKQTFRYAKIFTAVLASAAVLGFTGCKDKDDHYVALGGGAEYMIFGESGCTDELLVVDTRGYIGASYAGSVTYDMYSNVDSWQIVPDYSQCVKPDSQWIESWPSEGNHDGRFTISFAANIDQGETRYADINIVSKGKIVKTIKVEQSAAAQVLLSVTPFLKNTYFNANDTKVQTIAVNANVFWEVMIPDDAEDWVVVSDITQSKFDVTVKPNTTGMNRAAVLQIFQVSNPNNVERITITQYPYDAADEE